mgnify:CR=1 FL=1
MADILNYNDVRISELDSYLFGQGTHYEIYNKMGAHVAQKDGKTGVYFAVWAPAAKDVYVIGEFNDWKAYGYDMKKISDGGIYELFIEGAMKGQMYKYLIIAQNGEAIYKADPYANAAQLRPETASIVADLNSFTWTDSAWVESKKKENHLKSPMSIYECHLGSWKKQEDGTEDGYINYRDIAPDLAAYVSEMGYTHIELMGIAEYPFDGSWGYQVTGYYAPTARYGTPEDFMYFVNYMHSKHIAIILDWVPAHFPKDAHGLANFDGSCVYEYADPRKGEHPDWGTKVFDYGKNEVIHFLLSNCKYWLEEFHFDGFRFDGVTSMLYYSHGLGEAFCNYGDYFNGHEDDNAICYLTIANKLIHEINPNAITIAEEVSGMPGLAAKFEDGGYGFDYRMAMNIPDYWIKTIKEQSDENWKPSSIFWEVKNRRPDEKTISYCESHDQALVGDKTIVFRLIDADMYWHFKKGDENEVVHRGIALHKMIRLVTAAAINGGYLNFMGNEFGHPEWIDFPREGNGWSYKYARRQWNLVDNKDLCYHYLGDFDREMLSVIKSVRNFQRTNVQEIWHNDGDQILAFMRGDLIFVFNFNPTRSFTDYGFLVPTGSYDVVLNTDAKKFGGNGLADDSMTHMTNFDPLYVKDHKEWLKLYIPARSAVVLKKN